MSFFFLFFGIEKVSLGRTLRFGEQLCKNPQYQCYTVKRGDSWLKLWPSEHDRTIIEELNRMNVSLAPGMKIAIPHNNLASLTRLEISPLPKKLPSNTEKLIQVDLSHLAWGAYDVQGNLIQWGAASGGQKICPDIHRACATKTGDFRVIYKEGVKCKSSLYPVGEGGAKMPYCMFFNKGQALHGSYEVEGYNASHGCVRLFRDDAKWLNENFIEVPNLKEHKQGTRINVIGQ